MINILMYETIKKNLLKVSSFFISYISKRGRLEYYEQACAVDSVTKKCAGRASSCRSAMLGILGTPLRTSCACQGTEVQQLYECMGWHRLLWLNPCVGKTIDDYFFLILSFFYSLIDFNVLSFSFCSMLTFNLVHS